MNYNFDKDLKDGKKGEQVIRFFVESTLGQRYIKDNDTSAYDLLFEDENIDLITYEVKTDLWEIDWDKGGSGNMAIEYKCRGKPSGIRKTKATYFAYYIPNIQDKQLWIIKVEDLKKLIKDNRFKRVNGGETYYDNDEKVTRCFLIDRYRYSKHFEVYSWDGRGWIDD